MIRIAINGFGRIGRLALRAGWGQKGFEFVGINDLTEPHILAHLLKYDSVFRTWDQDVSVDDGHLVIGRKRIPVLSQKDPAQLPWKDLKVDVVIESTGFFTKEADAFAHIDAGAKTVVISAPSKDAPTHLMGVNHKQIVKDRPVICNASCTTNSAGPVVSVLEETFGIEKAMLSTIHSVTNGQNVVDSVPPKRKPDLRRARSVLGNIIPTSTGAAKATARAIPSMEGKFDGVAIRVPSPNVSLSDFTFLLKRSTTAEELNEVFRKAAASKNWKGILAVTEEPVVSSDMIGNPHGATVDLSMTRVVDGNLVKIMAWYDNEWGYTNQLLSMVREISKQVLRKK